MNDSQTAMYYQKRLRWKTAAHEWKRLLEAQPNNQRFLSNLAKCYRMLGDPEKEIQIIEAIKHLDVLSEDGINAVAWFYLSIGQADIALDYYQSLKEEDINRICSRVGIALCYIAIGQKEIALAHLNEARTRLTATEWDEHLCLARAFLHLGRYKQFFRYAIEALSLAPSILSKTYIFSVLLSYPLLVLRTKPPLVRLLSLFIPWFLMLVLQGPWASIVFLLILPIWLGAAIQSWLSGQRELGLYALGVLILSFTLLILK